MKLRRTSWQRILPYFSCLLRAKNKGLAKIVRSKEYCSDKNKAPKNLCGQSFGIWIKRSSKSFHRNILSQILCAQRLRLLADFTLFFGTHRTPPDGSRRGIKFNGRLNLKTPFYFWQSHLDPSLVAKNIAFHFSSIMELKSKVLWKRKAVKQPLVEILLKTKMDPFLISGGGAKQALLMDSPEDWIFQVSWSEGLTAKVRRKEFAKGAVTYLYEGGQIKP